MDAKQKHEFVALLTKVMGGYGKALPEPGILKSWWEFLSPFPMPMVVKAFASYCDENGEFAPVPVGIAKRCKLMDGRPTDEEAWAVALASRDEADTVVWTSETAEAFVICSPVLQMGDEVGARMAFKDAYNRLVSAARLAGKPAQWAASLGWDAKKRTEVLNKAQAVGLLPAPAVQNLLPAPEGFTAPTDDESREGLAMVKAELAKLRDEWVRNAERRAAEVEAERAVEDARKREIAEQVAAYQLKNAAPMKAQA